jgi:ectoine hydroxylase
VTVDAVISPPEPGAAVWTPLTDRERADFERDGFVIIRGALTGTEINTGRAAITQAYGVARSAGRLSPTHAMHELSAVSRAPQTAFLLDHPATLRFVWSLLGWNVHVHHSHLDIHPPLAAAQPAWWHWHQDGGRQNRELESSPRPRMSVKVAYWFSDASQPGRGNLTVVPGSHRTDWLPGPPRRDMEWPAPEQAVPVCVEPGDAMVFDRRLWHARSDNLSPVTRIAAFFGYTYRWITIRDEVTDLPQRPWWSALSPVQRQLLGDCGVGGGGGNAGRDAGGDHAWGHDPHNVPLYCELADRGLLDPSVAPLRP